MFDEFTAKANAADNQLHLEHGLPLLFGKDRKRGLRLKPGKLELEIVTVGENGVTLDDILVHDERNKTMAMMLAHLQPPAFPVATGVIYCDPAPRANSHAETGASTEPCGVDGERVPLRDVGETWPLVSP